MCSCGLIGSQCFSASYSINLLYRSTNSISLISPFIHFSDKFIYVSSLIASIRSLNSCTSIFPAMSISCSILNSWFIGRLLPFLLLFYIFCISKFNNFQWVKVFFALRTSRKHIFSIRFFHLAKHPALTHSF